MLWKGIDLNQTFIEEKDIKIISNCFTQLQLKLSCISWLLIGPRTLQRAEPFPNLTTEKSFCHVSSLVMEANTAHTCRLANDIPLYLDKMTCMIQLVLRYSNLSDNWKATAVHMLSHSLGPTMWNTKKSGTTGEKNDSALHQTIRNQF